MEEEGDNPQHFILRMLAALFGISYEFWVIGFFASLLLIGWISSWEIFQPREIAAYQTITVNASVYAQFHKLPEQLLGTYSQEVQVKHIAQKEWWGRENYTQCVFVVESANLPDNIVDVLARANASVKQIGLPVEFGSTSLTALNKTGVSCDLDVYDVKLYVLVGGDILWSSEYQVEGDFMVLTRRSGTSYEAGYVLIPIELYDSILGASIKGNTYTLAEWTKHAIPPSRIIAGYQAAAGDPNGFDSWVISHKDLLTGIYGVTPVMSAQAGETSVEVTVGTQEYDGRWDCGQRYKGNCRDRIWVTKTRDTSEMQPRTIILGSYTLP